MIKFKLLIFAGIIVLAGGGALVFFYYRKTAQNPAPNDNFIQNSIQSPAVEGNIVNSGISGIVVLLGGGAYEYEASLEIFKADDMSKPFISVRTDAKGSFQVPLRPGSYILKPVNPDGPVAPIREQYAFTVGDGRWLMARVEYK